MKQLIKAWNDCQLIKVFEIPVIDRRTVINSMLFFDIEIKDGEFLATHEALTAEQEESSIVAFTAITLDPGFSLDENLQALFGECQQAIIDSEYFELSED